MFVWDQPINPIEGRLMSEVMDAVTELLTQDGAEASFEELPCMAIIECGGVVIARNALTRRLTGYRSDARLDEVLLGAYDFQAQDRRYRFDCLAIRREGPPMQVSAAAQPWVWKGEACRLVLLMERTEGFAGANETDGGFLEDLLDATPEGTAITHEGRVLHVNQEFTRRFGYTAAECIGEQLDDLVLPDARKQEQAMVETALQEHGRASFETVRRTRLGERVTVCIVASRVRLGGDARGMFITFRDIRRQKQHEAKLQHAALHDELTGLANRALFHDRVGLTIARLHRQPERSFAVVFLDLDGFKKVNDQLGHAAGDRLLQHVAERLLLCLRPQDTVARFGGDEFGLLLDEAGGAENVNRLLDRVQSELHRPMELNGAEARVTASIGVALGAMEYLSSEEMLRDADVAMYQAKAGGKGRYMVFERKPRVPGPPLHEGSQGAAQA
jgi:diguanylate cyclase (GGDEF)-like protein/PAS domain S-box-containing protein